MSALRFFYKLFQDRPVLWFLIVALLVHSGLSFFTPSFNYLLQTDARMLQVGREAAHLEFFGDVSEFFNGKSNPPNKLEINKCLLPTIILDELGVDRKKRRKISNLYEGFEDHQKMERVQLRVIEKEGISFSVMTFSIHDVSGGEALWRDGIPALITVAVKYTIQYPNNPFHQYMNRFFNASYLPNFIRKYSSGDWMAIDAKKPYCAAEYFKSILLGNGESPSENKFNLNADKPSGRQIGEGIVADVQKYVEKTFQWGEQRLANQMEEEINKIRSSEGLSLLKSSSK